MPIGSPAGRDEKPQLQFDRSVADGTLFHRGDEIENVPADAATGFNGRLRLACPRAPHAFRERGRETLFTLLRPVHRQRAFAAKRVRMGAIAQADQRVDLDGIEGARASLQPSQLKSIRIAARCCFTVGFERDCMSVSTYDATWMGRTS